MNKVTEKNTVIFMEKYKAFYPNIQYFLLTNKSISLKSWFIDQSSLLIFFVLIVVFTRVISSLGYFGYVLKPFMMKCFE